jgi:molybdopterin synthase sulfur carrier subunit
MAQVMLRAPLSELCGGRTHAIQGATVSEVLVALERAHPPIAGWVLDERGRIREHVNVFVNGTHGEERTPVTETDRVHVLPAITGG